MKMNALQTMHHLDYLGFRRFSPAPQLAEIVQCYWAIDFCGSPDSAPLERLYSKGQTGITFNFAENPIVNGTQQAGKSLFDGTNGKAKLFTAAGRIKTIGVRFHPGGAYLLTRIPQYELTKSPFQLEEMELREGREIYQQLLEISGAEGRIAKLESWLMKLLTPEIQLNHVTKHAIKLLDDFRGNVRIKRVAENCGVHLRSLERRFRTEVGVSPKRYAQFQKLEQARLLLKSQPDMSPLDIGLSSGFFDQAHLIRSFKQIVGVTPNEYRRQKLSANYSNQTLN